jgi:hypothetical protein
VKRFHVFTLVPDAFTWFVNQHPVSTAIKASAVSISAYDLRDYGLLPHHEVDDTPYGGGPGMVTRVDVVADALRGVFGVPAEQVRESRDVYVLSAGGRPFQQSVGLDFARTECYFADVLRASTLEWRVCSPRGHCLSARTCWREESVRLWWSWKLLSGICLVRWVTRTA